MRIIIKDTIEKRFFLKPLEFGGDFETTKKESLGQYFELTRLQYQNRHRSRFRESSSETIRQDMIYLERKEDIRRLSENLFSGDGSFSLRNPGKINAINYYIQESLYLLYKDKIFEPDLLHFQNTGKKFSSSLYVQATSFLKELDRFKRLSGLLSKDDCWDIDDFHQNYYNDVRLYLRLTLRRKEGKYSWEEIHYLAELVIDYAKLLYATKMPIIVSKADSTYFVQNTDLQNKKIIKISKYRLPKNKGKNKYGNNKDNNDKCK